MKYTLSDRLRMGWHGLHCSQDCNKRYWLGNLACRLYSRRVGYILLLSYSFGKERDWMLGIASIHLPYISFELTHGKRCVYAIAAEFCEKIVLQRTYLDLVSTLE